MPATVELFDHTADMGIRVSAGTREELVAGAIEGLYQIIGRLEPSAEKKEATLEFSGVEDAELLRDLLTEVLFRFEHEQLMLTHVRVHVFANHALRVSAQVSKVDSVRSEFLHEVKAITYHELVVRRTVDGWEARIIVDI